MQPLGILKGKENKMPEKLIDILLQLSNGLHWLGRYHDSNQLACVVVLLRAKNIETVEQLEQALKEIK